MLTKQDNIGDNFTGLLKHVKTSQLLVNTLDEWPSIELRAESWIKNESFRFCRKQDGTYKIVSELNGKVMDVCEGASEDGTRICLWDDHGGSNQSWNIEELDWDVAGHGKAIILSPVCAPNSALDYDGNVLQLWGRHGGYQQQFVIYRVSPEKHSGVSENCQDKTTERDCAKPPLQNDKTVTQSWLAAGALPRSYYLFQSGFALETEKSWIIFDYYLDMPVKWINDNGEMKLAQTKTKDGSSVSDGIINADMFKGKRVFVFVSHSHADHFNPIIYEWQKQHSNITYIVSDDVAENSAATCKLNVLRAGEDLKIDGVAVYTIKSSDKGVAFLVDIDGLLIYHAGDHGNWVHNQPELAELYLQKKYAAELGKLKPFVTRPIDIAFLPVVPPFEGEYYLFALDCFMRSFNVKHAVPMHFAFDPNGFSVFEKLRQNSITEPYRNKIVQFSKQGDRLNL
jgi:L-ascorbate metabolism protein UlaG (beta-lactamase superfamily)